MRSLRAAHFLFIQENAAPKKEIRKGDAMDARKDLLLRSAARLYCLGLDLEAAKERVRKLATDGVRYDAPEMAQAAQEYTELKTLWDSLEAEHLKLKREILNE